MKHIYEHCDMPTLDDLFRLTNSTGSAKPFTDFTELSHAEDFFRQHTPGVSLTVEGERILAGGKEVGKVLRLPSYSRFSVYFRVDHGLFDLIATFEPLSRFAIPCLLRMVKNAPFSESDLLIVGHDASAPATLDTEAPGLEAAIGKFPRVEVEDLRHYHVMCHPEDLGQDF